MVEIVAKGGTPARVQAEMLAVGVFKGDDLPSELDAAAGVLSEGDFSGKKGETALLYAPDGLAARRLLLVGLGDKSSFGLDDLRRAAATAAKRARGSVDEVAFVLPTSEGSAARVAAAEVAAEGAALGLYRFDRHKTGEETRELGAFALVHDDEGTEEGAGRGTKIAAGAILARDLANEPSNTATPEYLAERAREISDRYDMGLTILDRAAIEAEGLNGLATVGRSARNEPRFIVLEHRRGGEAAPVVLVGKAVTFDSGGISIKPSAGMEDMKYDMSGGAAVLGAMESVGAL
ncbi:MAG TPA: M17 family peptidase N-terminal domain-containing protein, partial [Rubrobacteraceae bacterium]|nr:M17 family peptidase N-terminal domain-containing protein [Rubrobacteraceae bacterium]